MTTTHTPGPWADTGLPSTCDHRAIAADGPTLIAFVPKGGAADKNGQVSANARLIAAAPDLLAACKIVLTRLDLEAAELNDQGKRPIFPESALRSDLRDAIAKAEGR